MTDAARIADELYALAPDEFTAARDKAAKAARDDGEREVADTVKKFRRPSISAWLVNTIARTDELEELLDLGAALREAQRTLDGAELRAMSRQRHQVVRGLSELAVRLTGKKPADTAQREFEATLEAALADDAAAEAVRTGRLMRALTSTGLEPVDLTDAVAAPDTAPARPRKTSRPPAKKKQPSDQAAQQRRAELAKAIEQAEQQLAGADSELAEHEQQAEQARRSQDHARARTAQLEEELETARTAQAEAEKARRDADTALKTATRARDAARRAVDTARKRAT
ncbi:MAG TPA: hypothetical protein VIG48_08180 [Jatrophihabitans sp.]|jgi:chromosome segregation ATPase